MRKIRNMDLYQKMYRVIFERANSRANRQSFGYIADRSNRRARAGKR